MQNQRPCNTWTARLAWIALVVLPLAALAQQPTAEKGGADSAAAKKPDAAAGGLGQRSEREIGPGEQLSFSQSEVAAEMSDLEQRMFRLSEALKALEPENSSRLMLGLKYAREELILLQMQEIQTALSSLSLKDAVEEQQKLISKLERLQQLLISDDLDFEMKLERLRQVRETLKKLEAVIREESAEEKASKAAAEKERELSALDQRVAALEQLIKQQNEHLASAAPLAQQQSAQAADGAGKTNDAGQGAGEGAGQGVGEGAAGQGAGEASAKLGQAQDKTRNETKELSAQSPPNAKKNLNDAEREMKSAVDALAKPEPAAAVPAMQEALSALKRELEETKGQHAQAKEALDKENLEAMRKEQEKTRANNMNVSEMTRALGATGTAALAELSRANAAMSGAEASFGGGQSGEANGQQGDALSALKYARELLADEAERLARQVRREVKKRVIAGVTLMLEEQTAVRERTERIAPGVKAGQRQALSGLTALGKREEKISAVAQDLINLVEETEFGITLPAALAAIRSDTDVVAMLLADGDASEEVINSEKQIEADLTALLEIVKDMTDLGNARSSRSRSGRGEERKEQDRIIAELRLIRLLQVRVQENTSETETKRAVVALSPAMKKHIEDLEGRQDDIRSATERLALERADDLPTEQ